MAEVLRHAPRDSFVLSTKIGRWMSPFRPGWRVDGLRPNGLPFRPTFEHSRGGVLRSLEQSWLRTGLARVDIVYVHDVDFRTLQDPDLLERHYRQAVEEAIPQLCALREEGAIGAVGVGLNEVSTSLRLARASDIDAILLASRYTLLEQGALDELLPLCVPRGIGLVIGGPYNTGILVTGPVDGARWDYGPAPAWAVERAGRLQSVCARHGVPLPAAALQFPLAHPAVASVIPGATSRAEILQGIAWMRWPIPAALWRSRRRSGRSCARRACWIRARPCLAEPGRVTLRQPSGGRMCRANGEGRRRTRWAHCGRGGEVSASGSAQPRMLRGSSPTSPIA